MVKLEPCLGARRDADNQQTQDRFGNPLHVGEMDTCDFENEAEDTSAFHRREITYTVRCLSGQRDDLRLDMYANLIVKAIDSVDKGKPLLLSLGLSNSELISRSVLFEIIDLVLKTGRWTDEEC